MARIVVSVGLACGVAPCLALNPAEVGLIAAAAARGGAESQVLLAVAYLNGDGGLAREPAKAAYWFEQAAVQGNAYAEERLADLYDQGLGMPSNPKLAFDWRVKAANRGIVHAQLKVGKMYRDGRGVDKDIDQAKYWFRRAAMEGNSEAERLLGKRFHYGNDVEVDRAAAHSWFERAAQRGYESAMALMNLIESIGYRIDESWHNRLPGLRRLANDGDPEAEYQLARRYEHGSDGVNMDSAKALDWYRRAASAGHPTAMQRLSRIHAPGADDAALDSRPCP